MLDMFPYPSGEGLHVGHPKGYIATDIYSRFKRMQGKNVLHPMGFDAFGLPAENYALKTKTNPEVSVKTNIKRFKKQLEIIGLDYDWTREISTTDPSYYKWTQWIFLQLFKKGLAYESYEPIHWCPVDKTGLANEDVENGRCESCGALVEKKPMRQWVLKITDYAEKLLEGLEKLDWPESIKDLQRNWIGKSEGAQIGFKVKGTGDSIEVFTTRADTLFGATYVVLAPEHALVEKLLPRLTNKEEIVRYIERSKKEAEIDRTAEGKEKTGVELKGVMAINPANNEEIPIWVADYVLGSYGTGAIMAVPAHDERDWKFAQKYNLPVRSVIEPCFTQISGLDAVRKDLPMVEREAIIAIVKHWKEEKYIVLRWKKVTWHTFVTGGIEEGQTPEQAAIMEIREETGYLHPMLVQDLGKSHGKFYHVQKQVNRFAHFHSMYFKLQDGEREEVLLEEKEKHEVIWLSKAEIEKHFSLDGGQSYVWKILQKEIATYTGEGILINSGNFSGTSSEKVKKKITESSGGKMVTKYKLRDWVFSRQRYWGEPIPLIHCEKCGVVAVPEKDLPVKLPKVKKYEPTGTGESPLAHISKWVNVKCPKCKGPGKRETNTMPQWAGSSWYWLRYMDPDNKKAFVDKKKEAYWSPVDFYVGGAEHATRHLIYARFWHKFLYEQKLVAKPEPFMKLQHVGLIMGEDGRKMSKRWGNVISPDTIVEKFGADSLRIYEMFMGPFDQAIAWNTNNLVGARRFIERVWSIQRKVLTDKKFMDATALRVLLHKTIKKVTEDIAAFKFNTAISQLMIFVNECERQEQLSLEIFKIFILLLAPFAPHASEELWAQYGEKSSVHRAPWPLYDATLLLAATVTLAVQINGRVRASISISPDTAQPEALALALSQPEVQRWVGGGSVRKVIYVPGKILSLVV